MNSKSYNIEMWVNIAAFDNDKSMNNIAYDLTTLVIAI